MVVAPLPAAAQVTPPRAVASPNGVWPGSPQQRDCTIPVTVTVEADGSVRDVLPPADVSPDLARAAAAAARAWRFEPARRDGRPVAARIRIGVRFVGVPAVEAVPERRLAAPPAITPPAASTLPHEEPIVVDVIGWRPPPESASETVVDRRVIRAAPHRTASDMLLVVPGVFVSQHGGEGKAHQIFFRGFDAVHGQDMEIWAGGAPVNDVSNIHGQGYADLDFVLPEVVQQIHALPGNYAPEQGDFAVAGSIDYTLGYDEPGLTAKAALGSFGIRRYFLGYHPAKAPPGNFAAFETYATDGFGPARAAQRSSAIGQLAVTLGHDVDARVLASTYAGRFDSAGVLRLSDIESGRVDRFDTYDGKQGGYSSRSQLVAEIGERKDATDWSIAPYVVWRALELRSDFTGFLGDPGGDSQQQVNDATTFGAHGRYRWLLGLLSAHDSLEAGFFIRGDAIDQSQRVLAIIDDSVTKTEVDARIHATDVAGYVDAGFHPLDRVSLRGGFRLDGLSYEAQDIGGTGSGQTRASAGAQLSKRGTLDVTVAGPLHAVASYGEGFRSPQVRSLANGETTPFTRVVSYEGGARWEEGTRLRASAAAFRTVLSDDLVFDQSTARNERVPATRRTGVAASLVSEPTRWFTSSAGFTYARAELAASGGHFAEGDLLPYVPELVTRTDMAFTPRFGTLLHRHLDAHLGAGMTWLGRRPLPYSEMGHDVLLVDASAGLRWKEIALDLDVFNVLDADWYDGEFVYASSFTPGAAASLAPQRHVTVGPPRTLLVSLAVFI